MSIIPVVIAAVVYTSDGTDFKQVARFPTDVEPLQRVERERLGWYNLEYAIPTSKSNEVYAVSGYTRIDSGYKALWSVCGERSDVTRYSGWKMYKAIRAEGFGDAFDALMRSDVSVMIAFVRPQYFLSDDADFAEMVAQMCAALKIDDEAKNRILDASVDEP